MTTQNLADHVQMLNEKLNKITSVYVEMKTNEMTNVMVQIQAMQDEIDALSAYVSNEHDRKCDAVLRKKLSTYFSIDETKTLIHDMGISDFGDYERPAEFHVQLIGYCKRHGFLADLVSALRDSRPRVKWPDC